MGWRILVGGLRIPCFLLASAGGGEREVWGIMKVGR